MTVAVRVFRACGGARGARAAPVGRRTCNPSGRRARRSTCVCAPAPGVGAPLANRSGIYCALGLPGLRGFEKREADDAAAWNATMRQYRIEVRDPQGRFRRSGSMPTCRCAACLGAVAPSLSPPSRSRARLAAPTRDRGHSTDLGTEPSGAGCAGRGARGSCARARQRAAGSLVLGHGGNRRQRMRLRHFRPPGRVAVLLRPSRAAAPDADFATSANLTIFAGRRGSPPLRPAAGGRAGAGHRRSFRRAGAGRPPATAVRLGRVAAAGTAAAVARLSHTADRSQRGRPTRTVFVSVRRNCLIGPEMRRGEAPCPNT